MNHALLILFLYMGQEEICFINVGYCISKYTHFHETVNRDSNSNGKRYSYFVLIVTRI